MYWCGWRELTWSWMITLARRLELVECRIYEGLGASRGQEGIFRDETKEAACRAFADVKFRNCIGTWGAYMGRTAEVALLLLTMAKYGFWDTILGRLMKFPCPLRALQNAHFICIAILSCITSSFSAKLHFLLSSLAPTVCTHQPDPYVKRWFLGLLDSRIGQMSLCVTKNK